MSTAPRVRQRPPVEKLPDWLVLTDKGAEITLKYPLNLAGVPTGKLGMRRPKVQNLLDAGLTPEAAEELAKEAAMMGSLMDLAPNELEEIDLDEFTKVQRAYVELVKITPEDYKSGITNCEDGSVIVTLRHTEGVQSITLKRPKLKDRIEADKAGGAAQNELAMFSRISGQSVDKLAQLDLQDYRRLQMTLMGFMPSRQ